MQRMVSRHCPRRPFSPEKFQNPPASTLLLWDRKTCPPSLRALQGQTAQCVRSKTLSCKKWFKKPPQNRVLQKPEPRAAEQLLSYWGLEAQPVMHRSPLPPPPHFQTVFHHFRKLKPKHQPDSHRTTHPPLQTLPKVLLFPK